MLQSPWPAVAYQGFCTKTVHPHLPSRKLLESRVTLNNIFQHTQMDAERLNQLEARLENLGQRLEDLRGYL